MLTPGEIAAWEPGLSRVSVVMDARAARDHADRVPVKRANFSRRRLSKQEREIVANRFYSFFRRTWNSDRCPPESEFSVPSRVIFRPHLNAGNESRGNGCREWRSIRNEKNLAGFLRVFVVASRE